MEEMQQHNMSWIEVQFLKKAVDVLCQCRSTLMYTYVFAFYLKKNNQSLIFEVSYQRIRGNLFTWGIDRVGNEHVLDRGSIPEEGCRCPVSVP